MNDSIPIDDMGRVLSPELLKENDELRPYRLTLMDAVIIALKRQKIPFWVSDGTCLGTYRQKGMIKHDCDIDLMVTLEDLKRFQVDDSQFPSWVQWRDHRDDADYCKMVFSNANAPRECKFQDALQQSSAELDLYCMVPATPGDSFHFRKQDLRYPQTWKGSDIYPLQSGVFEGRVVPVPHCMKNYLEAIYGYIGENAVWDEKTKRYRPRS